MTARDLAAELVRRLNEGDIDRAAALFAPDAELFFPRYAPRTVFRGEGQLREFVGWLTEVLPRQTLAVGRVTATDTSATLEFETAGVSHRGIDFDNTGVLVIDTAGDRICALRVYLDTADLGRILSLPAAS
ncbi:MAG TPA: nuclear transport factor 2 family protein [Candidatus Dormibacteraeota bacterium]|jgi:ketosteroid isomerase-like protein|nr:nuclear transport factor 2 family protein [Candidatus Dormibacteraeota bacterium]